MLGRILDELEKATHRPLCWIEGHAWISAGIGKRKCRHCGARR